MSWRNRRAQVVGLVFVLVQLLGASPVWAQNKVRVGVYQNPPKVAMNAGRPEGFFIDVIEDIAANEGWSLQYVPGTFAEGLDRLQRGEIDLMVDVARTPHRERIFAFPQEAALHSWSQVYSRNGTGIRTILNLSGKRVAVLQGSMQQDFFAELAAGFGVRPTLLAYPDYASAIQAVAQGRADAVVTNPYLGAASAKPAGLYDTAIIFAPTGLYFAAPLHVDSALLATVDRRLQALKGDPRSVYFTSLRRWMSLEQEPSLPGWLPWAAAGAGLLLVLSMAWAFTLRRGATLLRQSEAVQRRLAEELGRIFDRSLDAICVIDRDYRFVRVSHACGRLWGYQPHELKGKSCLDLVPAEDRDASQRALDAIRVGASTHSLEGRALRKDGSVAYLVWSAVWSDAQSEMYCIARDDTERRTLVSRLKARTLELQVANEDLQTFSRSVSHDLRSPVSAISGFVAKVLRDSSAEMSERSRSLLGRVVGAAARMDQLIEDLLRLARISEHGIRRRTCDLAPMATEVAQWLQQSGGRRDVEFSVAPQLPVCADPQLVRIALENLIGNAWKFSARVPRPCITVGRETLDGEEVIFVRDNGAGFDMEHVSKIFQPFQRLHSADEFEGTGIGLSIVQRVVARHGGRIWAQAAPGAGAVFRFTLGPLPVPANADSAVGARAAAAKTDRVRVSA